MQQRHILVNNKQQWRSFVNLDQAIIKKSLKRVDSDRFFVGVLDFTQRFKRLLCFDEITKKIK